MFKQFINNIQARHFWRHANFSEVGQLYAARLMRTIAINLGAAFMSVYMLKMGYSVFSVSIFWACYFGTKALIVLPMAQLIANIGPKKAIIISNFLYIPSMVAFVFLPQLGMIGLVISVLFQSTSTALYDTGYLIGFSRLSRTTKVGKEVALINITEKLAKGISPLIGGILAMFFQPQASIIVSIAFFVFAAWPLFHTVDSMTTGFKLAPKGFPWRYSLRSLLIQVPLGFDFYASGSAWSLFLASIIFTANSNQIYAELGGLASIILLVSLVAAHAYGKLIDKKAGGQLLLWTAIGGALTNIARAVTRTPIMAVSTNAANEVMTTGYSMAYMRGMFDVANSVGYRVFYIGMSQCMSYFGSTIAALALALIVLLFDTTNGFTVFYLITGVAVAAVALARFRIYRVA